MAEGTGAGAGVRFLVGTGTGVRAPDGTGTGVLTLDGTGAGVRPLVAEGTATGVLTLVGTGVDVQYAWVGEGDGMGWRVPATDGTGLGAAQPGPPATRCGPADCLRADCLRADCLTVECADAESSRAGWLGPADATASPTPPASRAAAGSPSQAIVRVPGVLMLTSSSGRPGWPAVAVGTCGRPVRLHDHRVRYATSVSRPARPELPYGERT